MILHTDNILPTVALLDAENDSNASTFITQINNESSNSEIIIQALVTQGIKHLFLVPGKLIYPFINAIEDSELQGIVGAHETACGFMADGYARASRKFGVCLAISGPGTMNFIPAMQLLKQTVYPYYIWQEVYLLIMKLKALFKMAAIVVWMS